MGWLRIDDKMPRNPKLLAAAIEESWYYVCALAHCAESLTDGFIADSVVPIVAPHIPEPRECAERCVEVQLFHRVDGGYLIPDYLEYNPSREQVVAKREADKKRQSSHRESRRDTAATSVVTPRVPSRPVPEGVLQSSSSDSSTTRAFSDEEQARMAPVLRALADRKQGPDVKNPDAWRPKVMRNDAAEHGEQILTLLELYPDAPVSLLAMKVRGEDARNLSNYKRKDVA